MQLAQNISLKKEHSFQLQIPPDDFRERRFIFLETNRMPKEIREKLTKDQIEKLPYRDMTISQLQNSSEDFLTTSSDRFKTAHLQQLYHRKTKLWSGSIARRNARQEVGHRTTALDISRSLGILPNKTSDDFYIVSQNKNEESQPKTRTCESVVLAKDTDLVITNSEQKLAKKRSSTALVTYDRRETLPSGWTESSKAEEENESLQMGFDQEIKGDKCILVKGNRTKLRAVQTVPISKLKPVTKQTNNSIKTTTLSIDKPMTSSEPSRFPKVANRLSTRRANRPATSVSDSTSISTTSLIEMKESTKDPRVRKPVIPSLTQLTEVMNNCRALRSATPNDNDNKLHAIQGHRLHVINKYHGNQIVVDSTDYDNFARKQSKKN